MAKRRTPGRRPFKSRLRNAFVAVAGFTGFGGAVVTTELLPKDPVTDTQIVTTFNRGTPSAHGYNISILDQMWKQTLGMKSADAQAGDLASAARHGDSWRVRAILDQGDIDLDIHGSRGLSGAVYGGHKDIIDLLLSRGVKANANHDYAYKMAVLSGNIDMADYLGARAAPAQETLDRLLEVTSGYPFDRLPRAQLVDMLITRGADVSANNSAALRNAAAIGDLVSVNRILAEKATVTTSIQPPADTYADYNDWRASLGLDQGGCVFFDNPQDNAMFAETGVDPWLYGQIEHPPHVPAAPVIVTTTTYKANLNALSSAPLVNAARGGHIDVMKTLIAAGADTRTDARAILAAAVTGGDAATIAFVLAQPGMADAAILSDGGKAAIDAGNPAALKQLSDAGLDLRTLRAYEKAVLDRLNDAPAATPLTGRAASADGTAIKTPVLPPKR